MTFCAALPARVARGRPLRLAVRAALAAAAGYAAVRLVPGTPSAPATAFGCALWWLLTARADLAHLINAVARLGAAPKQKKEY